MTSTATAAVTLTADDAALIAAVLLDLEGSTFGPLAAMAAGALDLLQDAQAVAGPL